MSKHAAKREELYRKVILPRNPTPIDTDLFSVAGECPGDSELREVMKQLSHGRMGRASKMRAEGIKQWLQGIINKEVNNKEGTGENWRSLSD